MRMCERAQYMWYIITHHVYVCMYVMYVHVPVCHVCMSCILQFVWWCTRVTTVHTCGEVLLHCTGTSTVPGTSAQCNFPDLGEKSQHQHDFCLKRVSLVLV